MPSILVDDLGGAGVIADIPPHRLPRNAWTASDSVRFTVAGVEALYPQREVLKDTVADAAGAVPTWLMQFPPTEDPLWVWANDTAAWVYEGSTDTHYPLTRTVGGAYAAGGERWQGSVFQGLGIFNQYVDVPQLWAPMTTGQRFINLTNWPALDRTWSLRPYRSFLMAMRINDLTPITGQEYPFRLRWSDSADPGTVPQYWTAAPDNLAGEIDIAETPDYIVDGGTLGDIFIVYKERSTWAIQFVGGGSVMRRWLILPESGLLYRDCFAQFPGGHFVVTSQDIGIHNGGINSFQSILENRLRRWLFSTINPVTHHNAFCCTNVPKKEIWFFFPTVGAEYANYVLMWNWETNKIGLRSIPETPFAYGGPVFESSLDEWDDGAGNPAGY